ncbi:MAG: flap endonuclease-1 [Candidatus Paceibacteria bacterium]
MGLSISDIIPKREIDLQELKDKVICVDAYNTLYQFLTTIRQPDGTPLKDKNENVTSHLSGIFYRNANLLIQGLKLIYVFDGEAPDLKSKTHQKRSENKEAAKERYEEAKQAEDFEKMKTYSGQLTSLDSETLKESKELLDAMGIPVVQAPSEGESQAAYMCRHDNEIYACGSQDYDSLLFGATRVVRNLTLSRKKKTFSGYVEIHPEVVDLDKVLNALEINRDQLICLGILVGTDYNPKGVPGIGQKKALEIVRRKKYPVRIFEEVEDKMMNLAEEYQFNWQDIFELFHKPQVDKDFDYKFKSPNEEKIKEILVDRHDFSEDRVQKKIDALKKAREQQGQKSLNKWF